VREEIFGPVAVVLAVESDEEAVRLANDSEYGLNGTVFSRDMGRAFAIARGVRAGASASTAGRAISASTRLSAASGVRALAANTGWRGCTNIPAPRRSGSARPEGRGR
jgi:acyl-CoA reductase-like NAD-dependent aldehyde dehydrogenase